MADYANITLARDGAVARLTLNRPDRRNALTHAMMLELEDAFGRVRDDPSCRVLVLRGAGGHFSAGGDLDAMADMPPAAGRRRDRSAGRGLSPVRRRAAGAEQPAAGDGGDRRRLGGGRRLRHGLLLRRRDPARERALRHARAEGRLHPLADHSLRGAADRRGAGARSRGHRPRHRCRGGEAARHRQPSLRRHRRHQPDAQGGARRRAAARTAGGGDGEASGAVLRHGG